MDEKQCCCVADLLKEDGGEVQLNEIVLRTKGEVAWAANPSNTIIKMMKTDNRIVKASRGHYKYQAPANGEIEKQSVVLKTEPPKEPLRSAHSYVSGWDLDGTQTPQLPIGKIVKGVVNKIEAYGVFADLYEYGMSGLIHKSNIKRGRNFYRIEDIERHFMVGDEIECRVISYRNGKLSLSTAGLSLPDHGEVFPEPTVMADKLKPLAQAIVAAQAAPKEPPKAPEPTPAPKPAPTPAPTPAVSYSANTSELETLYEMIRKKVGVISLSAKDETRDAVKKYGMVKITMALMTTDDFEADVSLAFVKHLETKASGGL